MSFMGLCRRSVLPDISTSDFEPLFEHRRGGEMTLSALRFAPTTSPLSPRRSSSLYGAPLRLPTSHATRPRRHLCATRTAPNVSPSGKRPKHPELELAPPESLRSRVLALQSVGIDDLSLRRTVARRPEILSAPELGPFLEFARDELKGLKPAKLERLLTTAHPMFLTGIAARVTRLMEHGVPGQKLGHLLNHVDIRKVFCERPLKDLEEMILFLKRFSWPDLVIRRPMILNLDLHDQLIPRVEFLAELGGGDEAAAAALIAKLPALLSYTVEHFESHLEFWRSVGLSDEELFKIALVYPNIFSVSKERKLRPRVEFLRQCGMDAEDIFKFLVKAPLYVSLSLKDNLSKKLTFLVKIGYKHRTRELALAVGATTRTSCENMQRVVALFFSYGLSCDDVLAMSKKHPQVLQYNHESLEKKLEFLIGYMERDVGEILVFPAFLGYKLDDRIKKRGQKEATFECLWPASSEEGDEVGRKRSISLFQQQIGGCRSETDAIREGGDRS
ncbi:hypothetical protein BHE74_00040705 [Ensete ventricosum]|nr:hypothetical protein BHE74_00040705 [Ensete ventricosum]